MTQQWCGHHGEVWEGQCVVCLAAERDRLHDWAVTAQAELGPIEHGGVDVMEHVKAAQSALDRALGYGRPRAR